KEGGGGQSEAGSERGLKGPAPAKQRPNPNRFSIWRRASGERPVSDQHMFNRRFILPTLLLSLVAGLGVSADGAQTPGPKKKSPTSGAKAHRGGKRGSRNSGRQRGQQTPTTDRISEIQTALAKDGSYAGAPSGKMDDSTVDALKKYQ